MPWFLLQEFGSQVDTRYGGSVATKSAWLWFDRDIVVYKGAERLQEPDCHDDVIKWKHFPRYGSFLTGEFPQRPVTLSFGVFVVGLQKRLNKQSKSHRAHYDLAVMVSSQHFLWNISENVSRSNLLLFHHKSTLIARLRHGPAMRSVMADAGIKGRDKERVWTTRRRLNSSPHYPVHPPTPPWSHNGHGHGHER